MSESELGRIWEWFADTSCKGTRRCTTASVASSPTMTTCSRSCRKRHRPAHQPNVLLRRGPLPPALRASTTRWPRCTRAGATPIPGPRFRDLCLTPSRRGARADGDAPDADERMRSQRGDRPLAHVVAATVRVRRSRCSTWVRARASIWVATATFLDYGAAGSTGPADSAVRIECAVRGGVSADRAAAARDRGTRDRPRPFADRPHRRARRALDARVHLARHRPARTHPRSRSTMPNRIRPRSGAATWSRTLGPTLAELPRIRRRVRDHHLGARVSPTRRARAVRSGARRRRTRPSRSCGSPARARASSARSPTGRRRPDLDDIEPSVLGAIRYDGGSAQANRACVRAPARCRHRLDRLARRAGAARGTFAGRPAECMIGRRIVAGEILRVGDRRGLAGRRDPPIASSRRSMSALDVERPALARTAPGISRRSPPATARLYLGDLGGREVEKAQEIRMRRRSNRCRTPMPYSALSRAATNAWCMPSTLNVASGSTVSSASGPGGAHRGASRGLIAAGARAPGRAPRCGPRPRRVSSSMAAVQRDPRRSRWGNRPLRAQGDRSIGPSSRSTRSTAPPPREERIRRRRRPAGDQPAPPRRRGVHLVPAPRDEVDGRRHRAGAARAGRRRGTPARPARARRPRCRSMGGIQPVTFDAPVIASNLGAGCLRRGRR